MASVFLSLGSNVGDRKTTLRNAINALKNVAGYSLLAQSAVYETSPVGGSTQDYFLNLVVQVVTDETPHQVLVQVQAIETKLGRERTIYWGPRTIDIDILFYDALILTEEKLKIPHPLLPVRLFVLIPLCDIASDMKHPVLGQAMHTLRDLCVQDNAETQTVTCYQKELL